MKVLLTRTLVIACLVFSAGLSMAQPPPVMNYQSVAKDPQGNPASNRDVYVKIIIYQTSPIGGVNVWEETHTARSDKDGIFVIYIGKGTKSSTTRATDIGKIDWANGPFFINVKVAVAPSIPAVWWVAADNYIDIGTTQLMSVPYALFAGNASVTNVNTSIQPGPPNTFLITDSLGNVNWRTPEAAQQTVTTITNFNLTLAVIPGQNVTIPPNTTAVVTIVLLGVKKGDPILVTPQDDYLNWQVYSAWVSADDIVKVRFANYTDLPVAILGSQYKVVVIK
ncbi:MAG: hypothetical protein V4450_14295 [Bacteroidota bacterium]